MARIIQRGTFGGGGMQAGGGNPVMRARQALSDGRFDEAERLARRRLERKPDDTMARLVLAQALLQMQQADEAAEHAQRVVDAQPNNADAHLTLSAALSQSPNKASLARAEAAARKASALMPRSARPRVQLAEVALAQRRVKDAKMAADEAIKLEPRLAEAHLIRGVVLLQDGDAAGASEASRTATRLNRELSPAYYTLALSLNQLKQADEAEQALDRAQELNAPIPPATLLGLRGQIYVKKRKYPKAATAYALAQRASGRPGFIAWPLGVLITFFSAFGALGSWGPPAAIAIVAVAILFGLNAIPVAGNWIVAAVLLTVVGGMIFGYVRGVQSGALGLGRFFSTIGVAIISAIILVVMWGATYLAVWFPAGGLPYGRGAWTTPTGLAIGAVFGLVAAGLAGWRLLKIVRS
jgi:tetratricopeptide (TPR) repeat protein